MGKYIVIVIIGIALVAAVIYLNRTITSEPERDSMTREIAKKVESGEFVHPKMVYVTLSDSLYHNLGCEWIGKDSKQMSLKNAVARAFFPCSDCIEEE